MLKTKRFLPFLIAIFSLATIFTSCQKNNTLKANGTPVITDAAVPTRQGFKLGDAIEIDPLIEDEIQMTYAWDVEGQRVSTEKKLVFTPTEAKNYQVTFTATNPLGIATQNYDLNVYKYVPDGGFFILNEGWSTGALDNAGSLSYFAYDPSTDTYTLSDSVFKKNNGGQQLGVTTQAGTIWNKNIYLVSKANIGDNSTGNITVADAYSLKSKGTIPLATQGRGFCGVDENTGVVTTSNSGAFVVNLNTLSLGKVLEQSAGQECGSVVVSGDYLFLMKNNNILIYNIKDNFSFVKTLLAAKVGFAVTPDGTVWAAKDTELYKINPSTLDVETITLPGGLAVPAGWTWNPGVLCASTKENALYFNKMVTVGWSSTSTEIYKYKVGDLSSLDAPFAVSSTATSSFYAAGFRENPHTGDLVAMVTGDGFGDNYLRNKVIVFDGKTGIEKKIIDYSGSYWFPALPIFY